MTAACAASRAQSVTVCWAVGLLHALSANAVPQAPAPSTIIFIATYAMNTRARGLKTYIFLLNDDAGLNLSGGDHLLLLLLLEHGLKVDFRQVHRRKASALDQVRHVAAQIGVNDLRTGDAHDLAHLLLRQIANFENTGLRGLHQKHGFILDLGLNGGGDRDLEHSLFHWRGVHAELNVH